MGRRGAGHDPGDVIRPLRRRLAARRARGSRRADYRLGPAPGSPAISDGPPRRPGRRAGRRARGGGVADSAAARGGRRVGRVRQSHGVLGGKSVGPTRPAESRRAGAKIVTHDLRGSRFWYPTMIILVRGGHAPSRARLRSRSPTLRARNHPANLAPHEGSIRVFRGTCGAAGGLVYQRSAEARRAWRSGRNTGERGGSGQGGCDDPSEHRAADRRRRASGLPVRWPSWSSPGCSRPAVRRGGPWLSSRRGARAGSTRAANPRSAELAGPAPREEDQADAPGGPRADAGPPPAPGRGPGRSPGRPADGRGQGQAARADGHAPDPDPGRARPTWSHAT